MVQEPSDKSASRRVSWTALAKCKTGVTIFGYGGHYNLGYICSEGEVGTGQMAAVTRCGIMKEERLLAMTICGLLRRLTGKRIKNLGLLF